MSSKTRYEVRGCDSFDYDAEPYSLGFYRGSGAAMIAAVTRAVDVRRNVAGSGDPRLIEDRTWVEDHETGTTIWDNRKDYPPSPLVPKDRKPRKPRPA